MEMEFVFWVRDFKKLTFRRGTSLKKQVFRLFLVNQQIMRGKEKTHKLESF